MKRLALILGVLLLALLAACATQSGEVSQEAALITDAELDAAAEAALGAPDVSRQLTIDPSAVPGRGEMAAVLGTQAQQRGALPMLPADAPIDTESHIAYAYTGGAAGPNPAYRSTYRIRVRSTYGNGAAGFPIDYLLYKGLREVTSVATSADGNLVAFTATGANGSQEVFVYDRDGSRTGQADTVIQLTSTGSDENDVALSLDGRTIVWQGVEPTTGANSLVIAVLDESPRLLRTELLVGDGAGGVLPVLEPSVSGDGSTAVFLLALAPGFNVVVTVPTDLEGDLVGPYAGDVSDPSLTYAGDTLMFKEVFEGVPYVSLVDLAGGVFLGDLLAGVDAMHPFLAADGAYFTYALDGDVFAREVRPLDPAAAEETAVEGNNRERFDGYQPFWAKPAFGLRYYGTTYGAPTFTRPADDSGLSAAERTVPYHHYAFTAPVTDLYEVLSGQDYDGFLLLYHDQFDPANPSHNLIAANDDFGGGYSDEVAYPDFPGNSRIVAELQARQRYVVVTTACGDTDGCGPAEGQFTNAITRGAEPPLPPEFLPEPDPSGYDITVRFVSGNLTEEQQAIFLQAAARWESIITGDIADIPDFELPQDFFFPNTAPLLGTADDVIIDANFTDIDGPGGVLGRAGPVLVRSPEAGDAPLTVYGIMEFDLAEFEPGGIFEDARAYEDTITHEMGHVIGIGTLWEFTGNTEGVLPDPPTVPPGLPNPDYDPRFTGPMAVQEFQQLLADAPYGYEQEDSVPIANTGGGGNYNGHWREITFDNELMTPYLGGLELLSTMTAASLGDLGYTVDLDSDAIDHDYQLPPPRVPAVLRQTAPATVEYVEGQDFVASSDSVKAMAEGPVTNVDLNLADLDDSTSGCEAEDFGPEVAGTIALVRRGTCAFSTKAINAENAGAIGVIIMNQGNTEERTGLLDPSMDPVPGIPVVFVTFDLGVDLANTAGLEMFIDTGAEVAVTALETKELLNEVVLRPIGTVGADGSITLFPGERPGYEPLDPQSVNP